MYHSTRVEVLSELVLYFHHVVCRDRTLVVRIGRKLLLLPGHCAAPSIDSLRVLTWQVVIAFADGKSKIGT